MTFRIEDQDPRYLIVYESTHEHDINRLQDLFNCWVARFERGERFGVIYVSESFDDHHEHDERDVAYEEAFTQLLNDFRRDYKSQSERWTVGFVRVFPAEWLAKQRKEKPDYLTDAQADADRTARYIWGVPGSVFDTFEAARAWLDEQFEASAPTVPSKEKGKGLQRVGLFYGSTTGMTEYVAEQIQAAWSAAGLEPIAIQNIGLVKNVSTLLNYDYLIFGIPTWNVGQLQDDWAIAFPQLNTLDFTGKQAALFGVGDQYGYPYNFLDAVGILAGKLIERGAELAGTWNAAGYEFVESKALHNGKLMGLGLDEVHQSEQTPQRIKQWVAQLLEEFALLPAPTL